MATRRPLFIKICGITSPDDALLAAGLGADAVGMIFAASGSRITRGRAKEIVRRLPPEILSVGVFRNESKERVVRAAHEVGLRAVQLHGHESPEDTIWIAERIPNVIRAFSATDPALARYADYGDVRLLIDSPMPGSGEAFDWGVLEDTKLDVGFILAGGLGPENVVTAIETTDPWGVDVNSGVSSRPGVKDPVKLRHFIASARAADRKRAEVQGQAPPSDPYDWAFDAC